MTASLSVRAAQPDDIDRLVELRQSFISDQVSAGLKEIPENVSAHCRAILGAAVGGRHSTLLVADAGDGKISGYILCQFRFMPGFTRTSVFVIDELFVDSSTRGLGCGAILARAALDRAGTMKAQRIQVRVLSLNSGGLAFWQSIGMIANHLVMEMPEVQDR